MPDPHLPNSRRPAATSDEVIEVVGTVTEALERVERARGHLYAFHQLIGRADLLVGEAIDRLRSAGQPDAADRLAATVLGRDVVADRWTFEIVEDFDDGYYTAFRQADEALRATLVAGRRHVAESEAKLDEQATARRARRG